VRCFKSNTKEREERERWRKSESERGARRSGEQASVAGTERERERRK